MPFESLATQIVLPVSDLPPRWLPLIHLYDPDLPLFPTHYFHLTDPAVARPGFTDRLFGYIERVNVPVGEDPSVTVVCNRHPVSGDGAHTRVVDAVRERLGLSNAVVKADVEHPFAGFPPSANGLLAEIWERVVTNHYGGRLPFGKLWDEVLGLARFVASWNSPSGRKGELIQTHYFASRFGERIQSAGHVPQLDFFLLPSASELTDLSNPLGLFPRFQRLVDLADRFCAAHCRLINLPGSGLTLSAFTNPQGGQFDTANLLKLFDGLPPALKATAKECYNAFDKGPGRTVLFLIMLDDLRKGRLRPAALQPADFAAIQVGLKNTYNSPKAIQIYAQQAWGNPAAIPIDTWIGSFFEIPLQAPRLAGSLARVKPIDWHVTLTSCTNPGKVERLLWVASQARKVHSSACDDALWCMKYASTGIPRGANPLACTICNTAIRATCPAFDSIQTATIRFNGDAMPTARFNVTTSELNNMAPGQRFVKCEGELQLTNMDDFSPIDAPDGFQLFPAAPHNGGPCTVTEFVAFYGT